MGRGGKGSTSKEDAARVQSAADRNPESRTAQSGFSERAQSAADRQQQQNQ
ncbi:hypothetical protein KDAU_07630 [Dictyobacter aurantiacus]|uniref:SMP domain-containing protein n=2 Tax=Dictyobacter aurantiacus TaxID=1936993 RepID=A0A401Z995_9CHLR|nr:hypothetical protein KDAU_07630 [Dictyobacter aurantiacus]